MKRPLTMRVLIAFISIPLLLVSCNKEPSDNCGKDVQVLDNLCNCKIGVNHFEMNDIASDSCDYQFLINNLDFFTFYIQRINITYFNETILDYSLAK